MECCSGCFIVVIQARKLCAVLCIFSPIAKTFYLHFLFFFSTEQESHDGQLIKNVGSNLHSLSATVMHSDAYGV